jgi:manganese transport protein
VLSAQLPFAIWPLLRFTDDKTLMGPFANGWVTKLVAWLLFVVISAANVWLVASAFSG